MARWGLLLCWLILAGAVVVTGDRNASWQQLQAQVATGQVHTVRVVGELRAGTTGYGDVELHWRKGLLGYTTTVRQARGPGGADAYDDTALPVVRQPPSARLVALSSGVQVTHDGQLASQGSLLGWSAPNALVVVAFLLLCAVWAVVIAGPEPWRATRAAWFWLSLSLVGGIVFLLASGPTRGLPPPKDPKRRLTGGWAFVLSLVLISILAPDQ